MGFACRPWAMPETGTSTPQSCSTGRTPQVGPPRPRPPRIFAGTQSASEGRSRGTWGRGPEGRPHARTDAGARRRGGAAADEGNQAALRPEEHPQSGEVRRGRVNLGRRFDADQIERVSNGPPQSVLQLEGADAALRRNDVAPAHPELFE